MSVGGSTANQSYDTAGRLSAFTFPGGATETLSYDPASNVTEEVTTAAALGAQKPGCQRDRAAGPADAHQLVGRLTRENQTSSDAQSGVVTRSCQSTDTMVYGTPRRRNELKLTAAPWQPRWD